MKLGLRRDYLSSQMDYFNYFDDALFAEDVPVARIAAEVGTPCYIYSRRTIERHWRAFDQAFGDYPHEICYAVKANGNLAVLNLLCKLGSGFDIVSGGELARVQAAGGDVAKTIFSGVCKLDWEIEQALIAGVGCFNIESEGELERIARLAAKTWTTANVSVRLNPDVDAKTHSYISTGLHSNKFGLPADRALAVYRQAHAHPHIRIHGVACHIGSQITQLAPYQDALIRMLDFMERLADEGIVISRIDFGGGLGVRYRDEAPPSPDQYWQALLEILHKHGRRLCVTIEPGRAIMANAGILLTRVRYIKRGQDRYFCIVDAGMNDLIRPALYHAHQEIIEASRRPGTATETYDVVGPVCESADFLGKSRTLAVEENDLVAIRSAGAYCAVMTSNYNARPRPAEVLVDRDQYHIVRQRESLESLYALERIIGKDD